MQGLPALRRSSLAAIVAALLGVVGLLYSNACCFECPSGNNNSGAVIGVVAAAIVVPLGVGLLLSHDRAQPAPCRSVGAGEWLSQDEWYALADCQEEKGDQQAAASSRAMAAQIGIDAVNGHPCATERARAAASGGSSDAWRALAGCLRLNGRPDEADDAAAKAGFYATREAGKDPCLMLPDQAQDAAAWEAHADCCQLNGRLDEANDARAFARKLRKRR